MRISIQFARIHRNVEFFLRDSKISPFNGNLNIQFDIGVIIGSDENPSHDRYRFDGHLYIPNLDVSPVHAVIYQNGSLQVKDLNSANGTYSNLIRIPANVLVEIKSNDQISFSPSFMVRFIY